MIGYKWLPGDGDDVFCESQEFGEVFLALFFEEVVVVLPVEDELDMTAVLERT
jgi:hypothetical protein